MFLELLMFSISIFFVIIYLAESLILKRMKSNNIILSFINIMLAIFFYMFGETSSLSDIDTFINASNIDKSFTIYYIGLILVFMVIGYKKIMYGLFQQKNYSLIINTIKDTKWNLFYIINKSGKVVDISHSFLEELGLHKEDVMGKQIMDIFSNRITFIEKNNETITNEDLRTYYKKYADKISEEEITYNTAKFFNSNGSEIFIKFTESPIFDSGNYQGRVVIGEKRGAVQVLESETKLSEVKKEAEDIRTKYIATIELISDGLYFRNEDTQSIWLNDKTKELIQIYKNNITIEEYEGLIHVKDYASHKGIINSLTLDKSMYKNRYRINVNKGYIWVEERGKLVETKIGKELVVCLNLADHATEAIYKSQSDLKKDIEYMIFNEQGFALLTINIVDIFNINHSHGYDIGTGVMNAYMEKLIGKFEDTNTEIYKMYGVTFGIIIKDSELFNQVDNSIKMDKTTFDFRINYEGIEEYVRPQIAAVLCPNDSGETEDILKKSNELLAKIVKSSDVNYARYSEFSETNEVVEEIDNYVESEENAENDRYKELIEEENKEELNDKESSEQTNNEATEEYNEE